MKTIIAVIALLAQLTASAQLIASFSGGDDLNVGPGTAGYEFTIGASPVKVQGLGIFASSGESLFGSHEIGIWDTTPQHNLLAQATVTPNGSVEIGGFWYVSITPLTLQPSTTYRIGALYEDVDFDQARGNVTTLTMGTGVTYGHAYLSSGTGFEFPDINVSGADKGFFGPNASFTPVPEPAAWGILTAGALAALAAIRRWKARQAAGAAAA